MVQMLGYKSRDLEVAGSSPAPYTIICANPKCGKQFVAYNRRQKYCCPRCRQSVAVANFCAKWNLTPPTTDPIVRVCANPKCGKQFVTRDRRQKYCCSRCRQSVAFAKFYAKWKLTHPTPDPIVRVCKNPKCGKQFAPYDKRQKYCCKKCKNRSNASTYYSTPQHKVAKRARQRERYRKLMLDPVERKGIIILRQFRQLDIEERCASDPEYYARFRESRREAKRRQRDRNRKKPYRPHFSSRLPDTCCKGESVIDTTSPFLDVNLTASQKAFARELSIERKEYCMKHGLI